VGSEQEIFNYRYTGPPDQKAKWFREARRLYDRVIPSNFDVSVENRFFIQRYADGSIIKLHQIDAYGKIILANIQVPFGGKKLRKRKTESIERDTWVLLVGIENASHTFIGILVITRDFIPIKYFKDDGSDLFKGFRNWTWDEDLFKAQWGSTEDGAAKYKLEELPRLSQYAQTDIEWGSNSVTNTDTLWQPGADPSDWYNDLPYQPVVPRGGFTYGGFGDVGYTEDIGGGRYRTYTDVEYQTDDAGPIDATGTFGAYTQTAYFRITMSEGGTGQVSGLSSRSGTYMEAGGPFGLFSAWAMQYSQEWYYLMGIPWSDGPRVNEKTEHVEDIHVYPSDGTQRRTKIYGENYPLTVYGYDPAGPTLWTSSAAYMSNIFGSVEGVWTGAEYTIATYTWEDLESPFYGCAATTMPEPEDSNPQTKYGEWEKWMTLAYFKPAGSETFSYSPCYWSYWWRYGSGHYMPVHNPWPTYNVEVKFDDSYTYVFQEGVVVASLSPSGHDADSEDCGIYCYGDTTIYVGHFQKAGYTATRDNAVYWYNGDEFNISDYYETVASNHCHCDAFDSIRVSDGYWGGQIRVAKLKVTRENYVSYEEDDYGGNSD
jgi:hypothetical protein